MWNSASAREEGLGNWQHFFENPHLFNTSSFLALAQDFAVGFLEDKLTPFYKSDPVPESVSLENYLISLFIHSFIHSFSMFHLTLYIVFPCRMMVMSKLLLGRIWIR